MHTLAYAFRVGHSTVAVIVVETSFAIFEALKKDYISPPGTEKLKRIAADFYRTWNFPNCVGAIDGKHIAIQCPDNAGSDFINYKGFHSLILMAICDARYRFTFFDLGAYGRDGDGRVFGTSSIYRALERGELGIPPCTKLAFSDVILPHLMVGDAAFPLKPYLMRPYTGKKDQSLSNSQYIFNYR